MILPLINSQMENLRDLSNFQIYMLFTTIYKAKTISVFLDGLDNEAGLLYISGRFVHNLGLEYFHLNPSPAVAAYMFRNHGSGSRPQLRLNTAWNYPQIPISQSATISARGSPMSLPSSQSVTITADSNFINSLSLTANRGLRSSVTSSVGYKNSRVPSHVSHR